MCFFLLNLAKVFGQVGTNEVYFSKTIRAVRVKVDSSFTLPSDTSVDKTGLKYVGGQLVYGNGAAYSSAGGASGSADSTIFQTKYRSDTGRVNVYAALNDKQDKGDSATYDTKYRSDTSRANIYNAINGRLSSVKTINNQTISGSGNLDLFYIRSLPSDFTTTNTTATNTGLSFSIAANEEWVVTITGHAAKATTNTGLKVGIAAPSGATITGTEYRGGAAYSTALTNGEISAINTLGGSFATGTGVKVPFRMEFTITNGSTAGTVELQAATVTSNTATIYAKTRLQAYRVNNPAP